MANEMTIHQTRRESQTLLSRVIEDLERSEVDFPPRSKDYAAAHIEECLDRIINEWENARGEVEKERDEVAEERDEAAKERDEALERAKALESELETMRDQREDARVRVVHLEREAEEN